MQITSTTLPKPSLLANRKLAVTPPAENTSQDTFTFSSSSENTGAKVMLGFGVAVTGLIAGAHYNNPAVMMGSFLGGVAIIVSANR